MDSDRPDSHEAEARFVRQIHEELDALADHFDIRVLKPGGSPFDEPFDFLATSFKQAARCVEARAREHGTASAAELGGEMIRSVCEAVLLTSRAFGKGGDA